jgi:hypothetical protein
MTDYAKKTDIEKDKCIDLYARLEAILKRGVRSVDNTLIGEIEKVLGDVKTDWATEHLLVKMIDDLDRIANYTIKPYAVGDTWAELNAADYSLIRDGLITIGAEANTGKSSILTALSLDIIRHNQNTALLFYSLDDSVYLSSKRILSQLTRENQFYAAFNPATLTTDEKKLLGRIVLRDRLNINTLEREAVKVKDLCGCTKIIIGIDYLQIIPNTGNTIQREFLNVTVKDLKEIQKNLEADGCILFLLSQLNRDTKALGYRYRETSEIENQSDVCLDIEGDSKDKESLVRKIIVTKNKLGRKGRTLHTEIGADFNFIPLTTDPPFCMPTPQPTKNKKGFTGGDLR